VSTQRLASNIAIRPCAEADIAAITAIYAHHVLQGLAYFELEPPSEKELRQRYFDIIGGGFPYLVAERAGEIVGYAYASPYRSTPAYRHTAENSVYLHPAWTGRSIGRQLMLALLAECEAKGLRQIVAVIGRQRQQRLDRAAPTARLCDGRDHPFCGFQIWTLGRYRADAAIARGRRQHIAVRGGR
jgi:L-amino acid N-acyltransferase YncA